MTYKEALDFLLNLELFGIKLGLSNIRKFLDRLGNPQNDVRTIHIAGTNGKGSVAAMIESMLVAGGCKVGKFTSPHLVDYRERFRINKIKIEPQFVADFVADHMAFIRKEQVTFFETATALAFQMFKDESVDYGIAEVGLGGRLDATNLLLPEVSSITRIAMDHLKVLGNSIEKIAAEKAGIIKKDVPVVTSANDPTALGVLESRCREMDTRLHRIEPIQDYRAIDVGLDSTDFEYRDLESGMMRLKTNLSGEHMVENAALALRTLEVLGEKHDDFNSGDYRKGLEDVYWKGRLHLVTGEPNLIFDVAHNPDGIGALADTLNRIFPDRKFRIVFGVLQRLDFDLLFRELSRFASKLHICSPKTERAAVLEEIVGNAIAAKIDFTVVDDVASAFDSALSEMDKDDYLVVTGSHFTLGEVYRHINFEI